MKKGEKMKSKCSNRSIFESASDLYYRGETGVELDAVNLFALGSLHCLLLVGWESLL